MLSGGPMWDLAFYVFAVPPLTGIMVFCLFYAVTGRKLIAAVCWITVLLVLFLTTKSRPLGLACLVSTPIFLPAVWFFTYGLERIGRKPGQTGASLLARFTSGVIALVAYLLCMSQWPDWLR
jgi:hypothetical protein